MARFTLEQFENFLKGVDLKSYREKYSKIKTVEMDLPRNIQALKTIYEQYWDNIDNCEEPLSFDEYYKVYWNTHEKEINEFWDKSGFGKDCDCFKKGLEARIYRTWASLITQIQGGYVAETVFGKGNVEMSAELDHQNIDILIKNDDGSERLKIQVKKETHRPEIARMHKNVNNQNGAVDVYYVVPTDYDNPYYRQNGKGYKIGDEKPFVKDFAKWYPETATMDRLDNGFIIFTKNAFIGLE
ncbi:TaqI family restriction endonuclease [Candidatus Saccharibacteria bacterium]|nr:TaqI family restriction endonuclease [Candidatus Saccharibacteria bacterium]